MPDGWLEQKYLLDDEKLKRLETPMYWLWVWAEWAHNACRNDLQAGVGSMTIVDWPITFHLQQKQATAGAEEYRRSGPKQKWWGKELWTLTRDIKLTVIQEYIKDDRLIEIITRIFNYVVDCYRHFISKIFLIYHSMMRKLSRLVLWEQEGNFDPTKSCYMRIFQKQPTAHWPGF